MPDGPEKNQRINEYRRREQFLIRDDENYTKFWDEFGSTTERSTTIGASFPNYKRPILYPNDQYTVPRGPERDEADFVCRIEDCYRKVSYDRVCPFCHNPLPNNYGKYPVKFLSVIGISGAGKTVFLSKLIENIGYYAAKLDMSALPASSNSRKFVQSNKVGINTPLPGATPPEHMSQPLFYNLSFKNKERTFVIYDIAGENCEDAGKIQKFGKFVKNSDGLIVLLDPTQIQAMGGKAVNLTESVLATLKNTIAISGKVKTPLALCFSKSDKLKQNGCLPEICFEDVRTVNYKFCATDYNIISNKIFEFLDDTDPTINVALRHGYYNYNYFAFTTLNCSTIEKNNGKTSYPEKEPDPKRIEEPLFWLFHQFGYIEHDTEIADHSQSAICDTGNIYFSKLTYGIPIQISLTLLLLKPII